MRVYIYTFSKQYSKDIGIELIPLGVELIEFSSLEDLFVNINNDKSVKMLITETYDYESLTKIKELRPDIYFILLAHQNLKPIELIKMSKIGIRHILNYTENSVNMAEDIIKTILSDHSKDREKRFHVRVQPKSTEEIIGAIFIKSIKKFYKGNIIDISAGGFAIKLEDTIEASNLTIGNLYDPVLVSIIGSDIKTTSTLVVKRNNIAGFKFDNIELKYMKKISEYIYVRLKGY